MTDAEKAIYDKYVAECGKLLAVAKADCVAIGSDFEKLIGIMRDDAAKVISAVKGFSNTKFWKAVKLVWHWIMCFTQFLDDRNGKFSMKRAAVAVALILGVIEFTGSRNLSILAGLALVVIFLGYAIALEKKA